MIRPDFLGVGAQKAGTTWLHAQLARHPGVFMAEPKELHFWDQHRSRGLDWYAAHFAAAAGRKAGEITPAYAISPLETVREIHDFAPDARILYLLRDPCERAWSGACMGLRRAEMRLEEASDQWFLDHFRSKGSLQRGDYAACLSVWRAVYPADQILTLFFDDVKARPRALLAQVAAHLGLDPAGFEAISDETLAERVYAGDGAPIRPSLRAAAKDLYAPKLAALRALIGPLPEAWTS